MAHDDATDALIRCLFKRRPTGALEALRLGADAHVVYRRRNALWWSVVHHQWSVALRLLELGADPLHRSHPGAPVAFGQAVEQGQAAFVQACLARWGGLGPVVAMEPLSQHPTLPLYAPHGRGLDGGAHAVLAAVQRQHPQVLALILGAVEGLDEEARMALRVSIWARMAHLRGADLEGLIAQVHATLPDVPRAQWKAGGYWAAQLTHLQGGSRWLLQYRATEWHIEDFLAHGPMGETPLLLQLFDQAPEQARQGRVLGVLVGLPQGRERLRAQALDPDDPLRLLHAMASSGSWPVWQHALEQLGIPQRQACTWVDREGQGPLHAAVRRVQWVRSRMALLRQLIAHGADVQGVDAEGYTPLALACLTQEYRTNHKVQLLRALTDLGASWVPAGVPLTHQPLTLLRQTSPGLLARAQEWAHAQAAGQQATHLHDALMATEAQAAGRRRL